MTDADRKNITGNPVLLYDGICALCNGVVQMVLRFDRAGLFRFAPLQSSVAREFVPDAASLDGVALVTDALTPEQRVYRSSDAVAEALFLLGWRVSGRVLKAVPHWLREAGYGVVARVRYRLFGRHAVCPLPSAAVRSRFAGLEDG
ncbi:MAG TPA: DCC1-like thiol-disulfide oxidoreductase family protein [Edaphobacter sp.]